MFLSRSEYDRGVNTFSPEGRLFQVRKEWVSIFPRLFLRADMGCIWKLLILRLVIWFCRWNMLLKQSSWGRLL